MSCSCQKITIFHLEYRTTWDFSDRLSERGNVAGDVEITQETRGMDKRLFCPRGGNEGMLEKGIEIKKNFLWNWKQVLLQ